MDTKITYGLIAVLLSFGYVIASFGNQDGTHYCEATKTIQYCDKLSSTRITCYTLSNNLGAKRCSTEWKPIFEDNFQFKGIYTKCKSGNSEAYYGEKFKGDYSGGTFIGEADGKTWICK